MICPECGKEFTPTCNWQKYCSRQCTVRACGRDARLRCKEIALDETAIALSQKRICEHCNREFKPVSTSSRFCSAECMKKHNARLQEEKLAQRRAEAVNQVTRREKTMADWLREADECNLDYGTYRTQIEQFGKTYEELKAQAENRPLNTCPGNRIHNFRHS